MRLRRRPPTINRHARPVHKQRLIRRQVPHHRRHLLRPSQPPHRLPRPELRPHLFLVLLVKFLQVTIHKRRLHRPRAHRVHAQRLRILHGQLPRHRNHRALGGAVSKPLLDAHLPRHRRDVDDGANALALLRRQQSGEKRPRHQVHAAHIHVQQPVEIRRLRRLNRPHMPDPRVVHQQIQPLHLRPCRSNRLRIGHIQPYRARRAQFTSHLLRCVQVDVGDPHKRARAHQLPRRTLANPARPSGHQRVTPIQPERLRPLPCHRIHISAHSLFARVRPFPAAPHPA